MLYLCYLNLNLGEMKNRIVLIILTLVFNGFCYGQKTYSYTKPIKLNDGWETGDLTSKHIDTSAIQNLFSQLYVKQNKIQSVVVVKDKQIVIEEYLNGQTTNQQHDLRSATKSIRSILLGIAIDKGFIDDVNDPISKYLKNPKAKKNLDKRKEKITIKHLLTMSSGLDCNDWDKKSKGQEDRVYKKKNWLQYTLNLPMVNEPGTVAHYCSMGSVMIAEIVSQASGMTIDKFAKKHLFTPLGIKNFSWGHTSHKKVIPSAKRLYMTARDMAKIGQLVLNKGMWKENQIVSKKWIEESTTPKTKITGVDYAYLWWNIPFLTQEKTLIAKAALGNGGQYILILPERNMVAVFTGNAYNSQEDKVPFSIMKNVLLPTITTKQE